MRPTAMRLRLPRVTWRNQRLFLSIPEPSEDSYFHLKLFNPLLEALNGLGQPYAMKDSRAGKLRAIVQNVPSLRDAEAVLEQLADAVDADRKSVV